MAPVPEALSVPHPVAGVRLHVTPALVLSLATAAVSVTAPLPAFTVVAEPDWVTDTVTGLLPELLEPPQPAAMISSNKMGRRQSAR